MGKELFETLPDVLDAKMLASALSISKAGAYQLLNLPDFPTLQVGGRKLVTKQKLALWMEQHTNTAGQAGAGKDALAAAYPEHYRVVEQTEVSKTYSCEKHLINLRKPRKQNEEHSQWARQRMQEMNRHKNAGNL